MRLLWAGVVVVLVVLATCLPWVPLSNACETDLDCETPGSYCQDGVCVICDTDCQGACANLYLRLIQCPGGDAGEQCTAACFDEAPAYATQLWFAFEECLDAHGYYECDDWDYECRDQAWTLCEEPFLACVHGPLSCTELLDCVDMCDPGELPCTLWCMTHGTIPAQTMYHTVMECIAGQCDPPLPDCQAKALAGACLEVQEACFANECWPRCDDKECGHDGCDGVCGKCQEEKLCQQGKCILPCFTDCDGRECGPDGCSGSCGECSPEHECTDNGQCTELCKPDCTGRACGPDGCDGSCGECPVPLECSDNGLCFDPAPVEPEDIFTEPEVIAEEDIIISCPPGFHLYFGRCIAVAQDTAAQDVVESGDAGPGPSPGKTGCSAATSGPRSSALLLLLLLSLILVARLSGSTASRAPRRRGA